MNPLPVRLAAIAQATPRDLALSGFWILRGIGTVENLSAFCADSARRARMEK
jgi:hypothetical protein